MYNSRETNVVYIDLMKQAYTQFVMILSITNYNKNCFNYDLFCVKYLNNDSTASIIYN